MEFKLLYKRLEQAKYYVFTFEDALAFFPDETKTNLKRMLFRWKSKGWLSALKKGVYELTYPRDFNIPDMYVANRLYEPSYVSLETALSAYSVIPEVSMAVTSISTKATRRLKNKHGLFVYHTVNPSAYTGYRIQKQNGIDIRIAEPEKALVDYLYFKTYRGENLDFAQERLDKAAIRRLNKKKLNRYAGLYGLDLKELYAYL